jgi:hypothetical protein
MGDAASRRASWGALTFDFERNREGTEATEPEDKRRGARVPSDGGALEFAAGPEETRAEEETV